MNDPTPVPPAVGCAATPATGEPGEVLGDGAYPHHVAISVADAASAAAWYQRVFDARVLQSYLLARVYARVVQLDVGPFEIELIEKQGSPPHPESAVNAIRMTQGFVHLAFHVQNCAAVRDRMLERGATLVRDVVYWPESKVWNCNFADCEGNIIEIIQRALPTC